MLLGPRVRRVIGVRKETPEKQALLVLLETPVKQDRQVRPVKLDRRVRKEILETQEDQLVRQDRQVRLEKRVQPVKQDRQVRQVKRDLLDPLEIPVILGKQDRQEQLDRLVLRDRRGI